MRIDSRGAMEDVSKRGKMSRFFKGNPPSPFIVTLTGKEKMMHIQKYNKAAVCHMFDHYDRNRPGGLLGL